MSTESGRKPALLFREAAIRYRFRSRWGFIERCRPVSVVFAGIVCTLAVGFAVGVIVWFGIHVR